MTHLQEKELKELIENAISRSTTTIIQTGTTFEGVVYERGRIDSLNMIKHWIGRLGLKTTKGRVDKTS